MNSNKIKFNISEDTYIEILLSCKIEELYRCEEVEIFFYQNNKSYLIFKYDFIFEAIISLNDLLKKALEYRLYLHESISNDIGYL